MRVQGTGGRGEVQFPGFIKHNSVKHGSYIPRKFKFPILQMQNTRALGRIFDSKSQS